MFAYHLIIALISIFIVALLSGLEAAFLAANRLGIEIETRQNKHVGKQVDYFMKNPAEFMTTALLGSTMALVICSAQLGEIFYFIVGKLVPEHFLQHPSLVFIEVFFSTLVILVFAEFIPKRVFLLNPTRLLFIFAWPLTILRYLMYPLVVVTTAIARGVIVGMLKKPFEEVTPALGLIDFRIFLREMLEEKVNPAVNMRAKIANNLIDFKKIRVRECMIPRAEIVAVSMYEKISTLKKLHLETEHSKVLIYQNDIDDIIGYCSSKELFKKPESIENIITPIIVVPEASLAHEVLLRFIRERKSLALVIDEFGGTSGIVSIEDIIEEIFGEIQDEYDKEELIEQVINENTYLLSARLKINDLNDKYNLRLPFGDYETLGGFITASMGRIPKNSEVINIGDRFTFHILSAEEGTHIDTVKLIIEDDK